MADEEADAWAELLAKLEPGEHVEWVVFGNWGGNSTPERPPMDRYDTALRYGEPDPPPVPLTSRGILLDAGDAEPFMHGWSFNSRYGSPMTYAVRIWTNRRIFWITQYDGATSLDSTPRHPQAFMPDMPGG
jgi:hypothetical protein